MLNISVFGMGYVGVVCSACLAKKGHQMIGVDLNHTKISMINDGMSPIVEPELEEYLSSAVKSGRLYATDNTRHAIMNSDASLICVGTPSMKNGDLDLSYIRQVSENIGQVLAEKEDKHVVIIRSTVLPGTTRNVVVPIIEHASGKKAGVDFYVAMNPEFLREGTAIKDFFEPPMTVIGQMHAEAGDFLAKMYDGLPGGFYRNDLEVAEMAKYIANTWHAVKVCFGNEVGVLAKNLGVDGRDVMELVCNDTKLNISSAYLRPGFAFGGSCLPKDVKALTYRARSKDVSLPLLSSIMPSNNRHVQHGMELITKQKANRIGMLGLSFKADTDDLRESPLLELVERLMGKGYELKIYDENVSVAKEKGASKEYFENEISHISNLLNNDLREVVDQSDVLVVGNSSSHFKNMLNELAPSKKVIDFAGISKQLSNEQYEGVCW
ncbi:nucleotide sugar dehydrogenase [Endozoicomonas arenosclerae]|uniref:nucleotide sugar dehydrogenase n=1 Tax=Endozoicomonas arenosclerae TaxID=1633495 RepID=UPI0007832FA7|nr:nucleotide sugar dehydrogenase [Endozoicomonas arenosclerae]